MNLNNLIKVSLGFVALVGVLSLFKASGASPVVNVASPINEVSVKAVDNNTVLLDKTTKTNFTLKSVSRILPPDARTVVIFGEIGDNAQTIAEQIKQLGTQSKTPIYLLINSPGGSVVDGALIISAMEASPAIVNTVCLQFCASMAAIIHGHGTNRLMVDRSILMFHNAAGGVQGTMPQMYTRLNLFNRYVDKMATTIATRAGLTLEQYNLKIAGEMWLDAEDATAQHFNDRIVSVITPAQTDAPQALKENRDSIKKTFNLDWK